MIRITLTALFLMTPMQAIQAATVHAAMKLVLCIALLLLIPPAHAVEAADHRLARDIMAELVAVNTAPSGGNDIRPAVALLVRHLQEAGFDDDDIAVLGHEETLPNLVVRYRSKKPARKPLLLMAHLDVVEALREDWTFDPFVMTEDGGYFYGRGTDDNKTGAAVLIANFIRYRQEAFEPDRDLIVMLTADEETTGDATQWLLREHRDLVDAEFALNTDGGPILLIDGEPLAFMMQTSEKIYVSFAYEALDPGGHSSRPHRDSAISRLARTLVDLQNHQFPIDLNETTRTFFTRWKDIAPAEERPLIDAILGTDRDSQLLDKLLDAHYYNAIARTTCVATQLSGGHAENALPQTARAVVNCRYVPQANVADVEDTLRQIGAAHDVTLSTVFPATPSPPSPLAAHIVRPIHDIAQGIWEGIAVIPEMSTGATDGVYVRNAGIPVYTVSGIASDPDDMRAHGQDERIGIRAFYDSAEYWYRLVKAFSASP